jgi:hypothetical protein
MSVGTQVNGFGEGVAAPPEARRTIPFDYVFRFDGELNELKGQPGLVHNSTVDISIEAAFTAVSIGYGVVPKVTPITFGVPSAGTARVSIFSTTLGQLVVSLSEKLDEVEFVNTGRIGPRTAAVLKDGLRFNPEFAERIFLTGGIESDKQIAAEALQAVGAPPERVAFKYSLFDQGTGREFQSEPILNIAGLGSSDGKRPFRYFARPIEFAPRSTIRLQIIEVSAFQGELHVALHGYKTLGTPGTPTAPGRARGRIRR